MTGPVLWVGLWRGPGDGGALACILTAQRHQELTQRAAAGDPEDQP